MRGADGERARPRWVLAGVGVAAGFIAGLFGVGGGIFIAPGLMLLGGFRQRIAHGTSLATSALFAAAGVVAYALNDAVDVVAASLIFAGSGLGVLAGVELLNRVRIRTLQVVFVLLLAVTAGRMLAGTAEAAGELSLTVAVAFGLVGCGVLVGLVAGLMGVGGGVIVVPALVLLFELGDVTAKGTSLLVVLPTAIVGTLRNLRNDNVDLRGALVIGAGGMLSAFGGGMLAGVIPSPVSSALFAALLIVIALRMIRDMLREPGQPPDSSSGTRGPGPDPPSAGGGGGRLV
ncbi:MAG: sulfite exporter TauE/SafE family protein [bacterium]|nr:sulfite exporter TauE/SafE family protein [bacterium]MXV89395.1 sulfite exporter TauE/SafE family protein [Acidimicrobiia bacterium]MYC44375.1 sulfite exporter TauE/SafE family protein [Acidimicrobiia bacterium]